MTIAKPVTNTIVTITSKLGPVRKTQPKTETSTRSYYTEIMQRVKEAGLLKKKPSFYVMRLLYISIIAVALWVATFFIAQSGNPWLYLLAIPVLALQGVMGAQYGFIAHESSHRQIFNNNHTNDNVGRILANGLAGLSYGFWMNKHNRHHNKPNQIGYDPDIAISVLSFTTESLENKKGVEKVLSKNQGWLFPFLLFFTGFHLLLDSFIALSKKHKDGRLNHKVLEFTLMIVRQTAPVIILFMLFPPIWAFALWLIMFMSFGFFMGAAFAPNHKGRPLVPEGAKIDFFRRQVLTSRNISGSWLKDNLMGGLNYQIEHHLFPSMPRPNLKAAHIMVKQYCKENNVDFYETGLFASYKEIIQYLNKVGLSNNVNPFECPMILEYRP